MKKEFFGICLMFIVSFATAQKDNPDCAGKNYDLFNNMEDFYLDWCESFEFKPLDIWVERGSRKITKEGKYTKLHYHLVAGSTRKLVGKQIVTNYASAIKKVKGEVVKDSDDQGYHVSKDGKDLWIVLSVSPNAGERTEYYIEIVEQQAMKQELIANIEEALSAEGKIALYGIYFDVNKAVIKTESEAAIKEIADYLMINPKVSVFIVGHTDNTGDYMKNIKLSKDRALAIKNYLITKYKIVATRLIADGVGPLAPIASNTNEEGKKLNRRVEVVLK